MSARWREAVVLSNEDVRLEPLALSHAPGLHVAAGSIDTFQFMPLRPTPFNEVGVTGYVRALQSKAPGLLPYCVIEKAAGKPVGVTAFLDLQPEHRALEIGYTWVAQRCRGTAVNPSMKLLMLRHAFETLGAFRVCLKTDARNSQSRRAIEKLGAKLDGILRSHMILPDGHRRDSAFYSILDHEWPAVWTRLESRIMKPAVG
jgi:RimJ/RimL family protein N-acetyltransferase